MQSDWHLDLDLLRLSALGIHYLILIVHNVNAVLVSLELGES